LVDATLVGVILAVCSAFCFAGNRAVGSGPLAVKGSDPTFVNYMSLLVGVPIAFVASAATLQILDLTTITLFAAAMFIVGGMFHFGLGRTLSYTSIKHIGANPTSALLTTQALYSLLLAVLLLGENLNAGIIAGTLLIIFGILFMEGRVSAARRGGRLNFGYATALLAGLIFGISPIVIKAGLTSFHFYAAATLVSFTSALLIYTLWMTPPRFVRSLKATPRSSLLPYVVMGVFGITAQLFRYASLTYAPVVVVAPLLATHPIFTMILTSRISKETEVFTTRTVLSIFVAAVGAILVGYSSGAG
jgi:drug/metabolite transporter (DMT)-like permease